MRKTAKDYAIVRFGAFEADVRNFELRKFGVRIKLQEQPFRILVLLLRRVGRIVSREELRQDLWPDDTFVDFDHSINTAMQKLRCALSDSPSNPRFVRTVPRRGYRFIAPVEFVGQQPSQDILNRSINGLAVMCAGVADFFTNGLSQTRDNDNPAAWPEET
jgi:DNA-binding winged helix-turn-helix (wHTH) protein